MIKKIEKKIIISSILTVLVVIISAWLVFFILGKKVKNSFENYQKEKLNSYVLEEKRNKLSKLRRDFPNLEEDKDMLGSIFVKKGEAVPFLRVLESIAADASCTIKIDPADLKKIKFEKSATASKTKEKDELDDEKSSAKTATEKNQSVDELASIRDYPAFTIEVIGHTSSLIDFVDRMENIPYFVRPLIIDIFSGKKNEAAALSPGGGVLASNSKSASQNQEIDEKNVKMNITLVVYGE